LMVKPEMPSSSESSQAAIKHKLAKRHKYILNNGFI